MCDLFSLTAELEEIRDYFEINKVMTAYQPMLTIAPTDYVPIVVGRRQERRLIDSRWGLFPFWAKDSVNADFQSVLSKKIFDRIVSKQRCVVPCTAVCGRREEGRLTRLARLTVKDSLLFGMAGLYEERVDPRGAVQRTFTIVTTAAGGNASAYWDGLPLILDREEQEAWLDPARKDKSVWRDRLAPFHADRMRISVEPDEPVRLPLLHY